MKAKNKPEAPKGKVKVLYQYLNGSWYAFADLGNEIFFGKVPLNASLPAALKTPKKAKKSVDSQAA